MLSIYGKLLTERLDLLVLVAVRKAAFDLWHGQPGQDVRNLFVALENFRRRASSCLVV